MLENTGAFAAFHKVVYKDLQHKIYKVLSSVKGTEILTATRLLPSELELLPINLYYSGLFSSSTAYD
jgi:hypothetical protein